MAERWPALRLTAISAHQGDQPNLLFDEWAWSIAGNLVAPIMDGGYRRAEVARHQAIVQERMRNYGQAVLVACQEVEDALVQEEQQRLFIDSLAQEMSLAAATLKQAKSRYVNGLSDYLPVLTALQVLQRDERDMLAAEKQMITFRIQLHRALGGAWPRQLTPAPNIPVLEDVGGKR